MTRHRMLLGAGAGPFASGGGGGGSPIAAWLTLASTNGTEYPQGFTSSDGLTWTPYGDPFPVALRDDALLIRGGTYYMLSTGPTVPHISLRSSTDFVSWGSTVTIDTTVAGWGAPDKSWAPQWFVEPADDSIHVFVYLHVDGYPAYIFELHPLDGAMATWSAPASVIGYVSYDPSVIKIGSTYFLFTEGPGLRSSSSLLSGYTSVGWTPPGSYPGTLEGPRIVQLADGVTYRLYMTHNNMGDGNGIYYSQTADASLASGWSAWSLLSDFNGYNHPVPVRV